jgi:hypothetical protein
MSLQDITRAVLTKCAWYVRYCHCNTATGSVEHCDTCIETDGSDQNPNVYTVRKMRISNVPILLDKISLDAYMTGLVSAQETAESWLQSILTCVYQSAHVEQVRIEEEGNKTQQPDCE